MGASVSTMHLTRTAREQQRGWGAQTCLVLAPSACGTPPHVWHTWVKPTKPKHGPQGLASQGNKLAVGLVMTMRIERGQQQGWLGVVGISRHAGCECHEVGP